MKNVNVKVIDNNNECYSAFANSIDINNGTISINEFGNKVVNLLSENIQEITITNLKK